MSMQIKKCLLSCALLSFLASCNLLMYDNREIPPRQISAMEHVFTKEVPENDYRYWFEGAILSGQPDSFEVLLRAERDGNPPQFLYLKPDSPAVFLDNGLSNAKSLMRYTIGFATVTGDENTRSLKNTYIDSTSVSETTPIFDFGTLSSLPGGIPPSPRFPVYDPQQAVPIILAFDAYNFHTAPYVFSSFQGPYLFTNVVSRLRETFSLLNDTNYPEASFWNTNSFNMNQAECLYSSAMLLRVAKYDASGNLSEKYIFLVNTQTSALIGPKRVFIDLPSVLFKDSEGKVMVLQAAKKNERSTTFQFLDDSLNIKKKLVVYGNSVYPLGYQTRAGVPGLAFLVGSVRWGSSTQYMSVFFLPLSKIGEL